MNILEKIRLKIKADEIEIAALKKLAERIGPDGFNVEASNIMVCGNNIDFDHSTRSDVTTIISQLQAGKWDKTAWTSGAKIDYETRENFIEGFKIRLWGAAPPDTCRIVEEEVIIPAQPAHAEIRKRLICGTEAEVAQPILSEQEAANVS